MVSPMTSSPRSADSASSVSSRATHRSRFVARTSISAKLPESLGAQFVVEGSVRKVGNRLSITAQLIEAESDHHVWAERYNRGIDDIFSTQDEIARTVAAQNEPAEVWPILHVARIGRDAMTTSDGLKPSDWAHAMKTFLSDGIQEKKRPWFGGECQGRVTAR